MLVLLGNPQPKHATGRDENDQPVYVPLPSDIYEGDETQTLVGPFPEGTSLADAIAQVTDPVRGIWAAGHSDDPPSWCASDNDLLASVLAEHFGCEKRKLPREEARQIKANAAAAAGEAAPDDEPEA